MKTLLPILAMTLLLTGCGANTYKGFPLIFGTGLSSNFNSYMHTEGEKAFVFDPNSSEWAVYNAKGRLVRTGKASGGADWCDDLGEPCRTVEGTFRVQVKKGPECKSNTFPLGKGGAAMPHCMFFHKGYAIHASGDVTRTRSHGCIRVLPDAAKWLDEEFMEVGTKVIVRPYAT